MKHRTLKAWPCLRSARRQAADAGTQLPHTSPPPPRSADAVISAHHPSTGPWAPSLGQTHPGQARAPGAGNGAAGAGGRSPAPPGSSGWGGGQGGCALAWPLRASCRAGTAGVSATRGHVRQGLVRERRERPRPAADGRPRRGSGCGCPLLAPGPATADTRTLGRMSTEPGLGVPEPGGKTLQGSWLAFRARCPHFSTAQSPPQLHSDAKKTLTQMPPGT